MNHMTPIIRFFAGAMICPSLLVACAPVTPPPSAAPTPRAERPVPPAIAIYNRVVLPDSLPQTAWSIASVTRLTVTGAAMPAGVSNEQRIDTRAHVSMTLHRAASGALRGSGHVDSFTVRSSMTDRTMPVAVTPTPPLLLIDAVLDSTTLRIVARPPLANECDRPEVSAMQLASTLLVRIPDGVAKGDQWRDSTVTLVCHNGVPLIVYTTTRSILEQHSRESLVIQREINTTLEGKGGTVFRAFDLVGSGSGSQRLHVAAVSGILEKLQGTSTLTLKIIERTPPGNPRSQLVLQQVDIQAERQREAPRR